MAAGFTVNDNGDGSYTVCVYIRRGKRFTRTHGDRAELEAWAARVYATKFQPHGMRKANLNALLRELPPRHGTLTLYVEEGS